jgi:MFS transporter, putative metabolite:H+ symporter
LVLRISVYESGLFTQLKKENVKRGHFFSLFTNRNRFFKYLKCIAIGLPVWFVVGVLITFSPEFGKTFGIKENISAGTAIMYSYLGLVIGDFASGTLSQLLKSRKKIVYLFLSLSVVFITIYLLSQGINAGMFYFICLLLGLGSGYWVIFATIAAEQFGTNLRATVATTVPNFVRGAVVPVTLLFQYLKTPFGIVYSGAIVGAVCVLMAFLALRGLEETFGKELNYVE